MKAYQAAVDSAQKRVVLAEAALADVLAPALAFRGQLGGVAAGGVDPFVALLTAAATPPPDTAAAAELAAAREQMATLDAGLRQAEAAAAQRAEKTLAIRKQLAAEKKRTVALEEANASLQVGFGRIVVSEVQLPNRLEIWV